MADVDWPHRWTHVSKILTRTGPFAHPDFEACPRGKTLLPGSLTLHLRVQQDIIDVMT